jgi:hypothetical protein
MSRDFWVFCEKIAIANQVGNLVANTHGINWGLGLELGLDWNWGLGLELGLDLNWGLGLELGLDLNWGLGLELGLDGETCIGTDDSRWGWMTSIRGASTRHGLKFIVFQI